LSTTRETEHKDSTPISRLSYKLAAAAKAASHVNTTTMTTVLLLLLSNLSAGMMIIPFESDTLRFMNSNGLANLMLLVLSFLFSPVPLCCVEIPKKDEEQNLNTAGSQRNTNGSSDSNGQSPENFCGEGAERKYNSDDEWD
jgi:hypothetical protein